MSFPPFNFFYGALLAFIPLYKVVSEDLSARNVRWYFFSYGFFTALISVYWIFFNVGAPLGTRFFSGVLLLAAEGGFQLLVALSLLACKKLFKSNVVWLLPLFYLGVEQFKNYEELAFPWITVYNSVVNSDFLIQIADIGGANFVTVVVLYLNLFLFFALRTIWLRKGFSRFIIRLIPFIALLFVVFFYGMIKIDDFKNDENNKSKFDKIDIALIHANLNALEKWERKNFTKIISSQVELSKEAVKFNPDLIVWGESNFPGYLQAFPNYCDELARFAMKFNTNFIIGALGYEFLGYEELRYNSAFYFSQDGKQYRYDKILLVPFGEVFPFSYIFPVLRNISLGQSNFSRGADKTVFSINKENNDSIKFSVNICYEGIFSYLNAGFVKNGAQFLVNISNDAWYEGTSEIYQHNLYNRYRAVENRVPVIRLANKAQNYLFYPNGQFEKMFDAVKELSHVQKVYVGDEKTTFFTNYYLELRLIYSVVPLTFLLLGVGHRLWKRYS